MSFYKFETNDVINSRIKAHPENEFFIYNGRIFFNNRGYISGSVNTTASSNNVGHVETGFTSLYELNVDRPYDKLILLTLESKYILYKLVNNIGL